METPQHTKENNYFRTKAENTIQNTNFAYPKKEREKKRREGERERAKKKRKRRCEYIKGQSLVTKLVVA